MHDMKARYIHYVHAGRVPSRIIHQNGVAHIGAIRPCMISALGRADPGVTVLYSPSLQGDLSLPVNALPWHLMVGRNAYTRHILI